MAIVLSKISIEVSTYDYTLRFGDCLVMEESLS